LGPKTLKISNGKEEKEMSFLKMIIWIGFGLLLLAIGALMVASKNLFGIPFILVGLWSLKSIKIVGPAEMAVYVWLGEPVGVRESGPRFVPWLLAELAKYPQKMYNFDYREREVISRAGEYERIYYGSQALKVDSVAYLNFSREKRGEETTGDVLIDVEMTEKEVEIKGEKKKVYVEKTHPLVKTLRAQIPNEDEKLKDWTEEAVMGALSVAFGKMTWMEAVENIKKVTEEAENVFKSADGALIRAGFSKKGIQLVIAEIKLPKKLEDAMPEVDRQRLEKEAAPFEAEQRAEETGGAVIQMFCKMTGMLRTDVEKVLKENPEEFVKKYQSFWEKSWDTVYRRMGIDGKAYLDVRTQNPLLDLIALWQRMPLGGEMKKGEGEAEKPKSKKTFAELVEETRKQREVIKKS